MFTDFVEELMGLDDADITERFRQLELRRRRDEAELAAVIAVADARGVWAGDGHLSVKGWLRANANWSNADVASHRGTARLLNDHPSVGDALLAGHIGVAQVRELARARSNRRCGDEIGRVLDQLVDHAEQLPFHDFRVVVKRWEHLADADGAHRSAELTHQARTASLHDVDGGLDLRASGGSALKTAAMLKIFERFVEAEFQADVATRTEKYGPNAPAALLARTDAQRRFDALVNIFETAAAMPADARLPEPVVNIVITKQRFDHELIRHRLIDITDGPSTDPFADLLHQYCDSDNAVSIPGHDMLRAAMTGYIRRVVIDGDGHIINYGRRRRLFSGPARQAVKLMRHHCDHVGCDIGSTTCQIDHVEEWARDNGHTDTRNGRPKCGGHNRNKHRLGITEQIDHYGKVIQFRRDGTPILPVGQRLRLHHEPDPAAAPTTTWPHHQLHWTN